ncbi:MAG TPA: extracellular solute-binding protein, partial [Limnochorda sp.]
MLLVLVLVLATAVPTHAAVDVIFWHGMGGHLGQVVQALVTRFNESQSEYRVEAIYKGSYDEVVTAAIAAYRAQDPPHLVQVYEVGTQTMLMSGAMYPVYQLMSDYGYQVDWESFVAPVLSYYSKDGHLYSMPFNSSTPILYYNKDAFAKASLDPNRPPETWDEVEAFSRRIIESGTASCGFTIQWPSWTMIENMRAWHGLPIATQENGFAGLDVELLINDEFGRMHIGKLAEWARSGIFQYGGRGGASDPLFLSGQCAIFIASSAAMGTIRQAAPFAWATGMLPHWGPPYEKVNSIIGGASLWVLKGARNPEAYAGVAAFLNFLTQPEQQAFWHRETGYIA